MLAALGLKLGLAPEGLERCLNETRLCFMFAQTHHAAMRHVAPVRVELGTRTIFNLLGPLANPASAKRQLLGVFSEAWLEPLAQVMKELGSQRVWTVHGSDGLDEMTTTGPTFVAALENGERDMVVVIPPGWGTDAQAERLTAFTPAGAQQDGQLGTLILTAVAAEVMVSGGGGPAGPLVQVEQVNALDLGYIDFLVPGILGLTIMQLGLFGVAFGFVQLKRTGALRRLFAPIEGRVRQRSEPDESPREP